MKVIHWYGLIVAMIVGCAVNYLGNWLIGVRIELFWGLKTFSFLWFLELFVLPVIVGISVSLVYGLGGKWFASLPPLIVHFTAYYQTKYSLGIPDGAHLMPMGWWGFFIILAMESGMIGGVLGEIANKRVYGWKKVRHVSDIEEKDAVGVKTGPGSSVENDSDVEAG